MINPETAGAGCQRRSAGIYAVLFLSVLLLFQGCALAPRYSRPAQKPSPQPAKSPKPAPETAKPGKKSTSPGKPAPTSVQTGMASFYANKFHGRKTASGELYHKNRMTAAHRTLPFNTVVRVTNLDNNRSVVVKINDRGPFVKGRIIDLSRVAAEEIGMIQKGVCRVRVEVLGKK